MMRRADIRGVVFCFLFSTFYFLLSAFYLLFSAFRFLLSTQPLAVSEL